jgi:hypothetical protein
MAHRFAIREETPGMWGVYDIFTGALVITGNQALSGMTLESAAKASLELNKADSSRGDTLGEPRAT